MFETFTEKARRVIFFARYDASQWGSPSIQTEHLLLGLLREDSALGSRLLNDKHSGEKIRDEIEKQVQRRSRISTSVEMPLSRESERVIQFATEESERLGHRYIGTEHLFLGLLREEKGLAATILKSHGVTLNSVRALLAQHAKTAEKPRVSGAFEPQDILQSFMGALKAGLKDKVLPFFSEEALFIDAFGNRWQGPGALHKNFDELFAPYAARNAKFLFEDSFRSSEGVRIATLLWEDVPLPDKSLKHHVRMSIVMGKRGEELLISLIQVTPVVRL